VGQSLLLFWNFIPKVFLVGKCAFCSEWPDHSPHKFLPDCQSHLAGSQETWVRNGRFEFCLRTLLVLFIPEGSFTCRKSTTWDRRLYFPSEGSFITLKNPSTSAGIEPANLGSSGEHANH
jgi:hypothetical protein